MPGATLGPQPTSTGPARTRLNVDHQDGLFSQLSGLGPCWVGNGAHVGVLEVVREPLELVREQMP